MLCRLILAPFFNEQTEEVKTYGHFFQDNAMVHTTIL